VIGVGGASVALVMTDGALVAPQDVLRMGAWEPASQPGQR